MNFIEIRPHHTLCLHFFEGKGYSEEFIKKMTEVYLLSPSALFGITFGGDALCAVCPNFSDELCASEEKVSRYDLKVGEICGFFEGLIIEKREALKRTEALIRKGFLEKVCGDCEWFYICKKKKR